MLARALLARAGSVREIQTVVGQDNPASLRMLARLGQLRSDCVSGTCDVVFRVSSAAPPARTLPDHRTGQTSGLRNLKGGEVSSADDEIRSGWMTTRDAELFGVLARGLTDDERRQVAEAITRADNEADQQVRRSRGHDPTARKPPQ